MQQKDRNDQIKRGKSNCRSFEMMQLNSISWNILNVINSVIFHHLTLNNSLELETKLFAMNGFYFKLLEQKRLISILPLVSFAE
jgi:hypothetical protein